MALKLKTYDRQSTPKVDLGTPAISYAKTGSWFLTGALCAMLDLKEGDGLSLHQDEENPLDWYVSKSAKGIVLRRPTAKAKGGLLFGSMALRNAMRAAWQKVNREDAPLSARMLVSKEVVLHGDERLFPILTSTMTSKGRGRKQES